jgi:hypothetical protein
MSKSDKKDKYEIIEYDDDFSFKISNLKFKKAKDKIGEYNKSFSIYSTENKKILMQLKNVVMPFGLEKYKSSNILNINIDSEINDEHIIYYNLINSLENELKHLVIDKTFENKKYSCCLKKTINGFILRTHIYKKPDIYIMLGKYKNSLTFAELKKSTANIDIELSLVWLFDDKYGILWTVKNIEIINIA